MRGWESGPREQRRRGHGGKGERASGRMRVRFKGRCGAALTSRSAWVRTSAFGEGAQIACAGDDRGAGVVLEGKTERKRALSWEVGKGGGRSARQHSNHPRRMGALADTARPYLEASLSLKGWALHGAWQSAAGPASARGRWSLGILAGCASWPAAARPACRLCERSSAGGCADGFGVQTGSGQRPGWREVRGTLECMQHGIVY